MSTVSPAEFSKLWRRFYADSAPLPHYLRDHYPERWLRIHSLPGSKRYPGTAADRQEVLRRQYQAGTELFRSAVVPCLLLGFDYTGAYELPSTHWLRKYPGASKVALMRVAPEDEESEATSVFGAPVRWQNGAFDELLLAIAEDQERALWLAPDSGAVLAPYDGGADLFFPTREDRDAARTQFSDWLPLHASGL